MIRRTAVSTLLASVATLSAVACTGSDEPVWGGVAIHPNRPDGMQLGGSTGPYTVECSGTSASDFTATVAAPDGWKTVFHSADSNVDVRESKDGPDTSLTGAPNGVSYLTFNEYIVDATVRKAPPPEWDYAAPELVVSMYVDCTPPEANTPTS